MSVRAERNVAEAGDFAFHAADIGHDRAGCEVGRDLLREGDDLIDGGGDDNEGGVFRGVFGRIGDGVAPRLLAELQARFGPAGPQHNLLRRAAGAGGTSNRPTEKTGGENGELGKSGHDGPKTQKRRAVSSPSHAPAGSGSGAG